MREASLRRTILLLSAGFGLFAGSGCVSRVDALTRQLESKDPAERIRAIHSIGEDRVDELLPVLVNRLDDEDVAVRLYAIVALEKLTGQRLDYEYAAESSRRRDAVVNWRRYIEKRAGKMDRIAKDRSVGVDSPVEDQAETDSAG